MHAYKLHTSCLCCTQAAHALLTHAYLLHISRVQYAHKMPCCTPSAHPLPTDHPSDAPLLHTPCLLACRTHPPCRSSAHPLPMGCPLAAGATQLERSECATSLQSCVLPSRKLLAGMRICAHLHITFRHSVGKCAQVRASVPKLRTSCFRSAYPHASVPAGGGCRSAARRC